MRKIDGISPKKLKELYRHRKMSSPEIARIYRCVQSTVRQRLREYGIRIRTKSEANRVRYNINISKKELKNLYLHRKLSSPEIAKIYHCSPNAIRDLLRKFRIKVRTKSEAIRLRYNINIPKKELKKLYLEKKVSSAEIARKFKCSTGLIGNRLKEYKIPIRTVQEALSLSNTPKYPRDNFSGNPEEKSYLIGFRQGDLYARQARARTITVFMSSSKESQLKLFENLFSRYGHIWRGKTRAPDGSLETSVCCYLNNTFRFIIDKKDLIEPWIFKNSKYFAAFLAGYTDAEGSFCLCGGNGVVYVGSQDKTIIHQIREKLIELGILCRPPQIKRKKGTRDIRGTISNENIWGLWVHRKDAILKLIDLINPYLKHADKRKRMQVVKDNVLERNKRYNNRQDTVWYRLYLREGIKI